jgi:hypothetical protein
MAAQAAYRGGAALRAARLYDVALGPPAGDGEDDERAILLHERGRVEHGWVGLPPRSSTAYSLLMDAARAGAGRRRVCAAAKVVLAGMYAHRTDLAAAAAEAAVAAHDAEDPVQRFLAQHAEGAAAGLPGDDETARQKMRPKVCVGGAVVRRPPRVVAVGGAGRPLQGRPRPCAAPVCRGCRCQEP